MLIRLNGARRNNQEADAQDRGRLRRSCRERGHTRHGRDEGELMLRQCRLLALHPCVFPAGRYLPSPPKMTHQPLARCQFSSSGLEAALGRSGLFFLSDAICWRWRIHGCVFLVGCYPPSVRKMTGQRAILSQGRPTQVLYWLRRTAAKDEADRDEAGECGGSMTPRTLNRIAQWTHLHPRAIMVGWAAVVLGLAGLAVTSAISLVMQPAPWKLFLFAATWLASWVAVASRSG